jgi:uncharacterized SAM-binding protein YcdF (DUF218 family)
MAAARRGLIGVGAGLGLWVAVAAWLDHAGRAPADGTYDVVVVLGCRPKPDGTASWCIERRTGAAVRAWRAGRGARLVITGGAEGGGATEASVAAAYARRLGATDVLVGETATSTRENALEVRGLVGEASALVVTDQPHCWRAVRTFAAAGVAAGCEPVVLGWSARAPMALREVAAVAWYAGQGWL